MNTRPLWFCRLYSLPLLLFVRVTGISDIVGVDARRWAQCINDPRMLAANHSDLLALLFGTLPEFRTLVYYRARHASYLLRAPFQMLFKGEPTLQFGTVDIGPGCFIQHGVSTGIDAESIGEDAWINQSVTIGNTSKGKPTIGNRVTIAVGAIIVGPVTIGDDAVIGANATVVTDVPAGAVFVGPKAVELTRSRSTTETP